VFGPVGFNGFPHGNSAPLPSCVRNRGEQGVAQPVENPIQPIDLVGQFPLGWTDAGYGRGHGHTSKVG
jgi:hypothetical protein